MISIYFVHDVAGRLGVGFMTRDLMLSQICDTMLGFMHGRCPASVDIMKIELENSYANMLVDVRGKLTDADQQRLLAILQRHSNLK